MKQSRKSAPRAATVLILVLFSLCIWWPLWFMVSGVFMPLDELNLTIGPALGGAEVQGGYAFWPVLPTYPTLAPLIELLLDTPQYFIMFWNTCFMAFSQVLGQFLIAAPAAWALAQFKFPFKKALFVLYIVLMILPFQVLMVPNYIIASQLKLLNTYWAVILPGIFSAFPVFIMTKNFENIPRELTEAASLDGASAVQIFIKVGVPLGTPGILAALVLGFIESFNAVEQPLLFLQDKSKWPLSLYMTDIISENLGVAMAASLFALLPPLLVFSYGQKYLELGIQTGGVKG